MDQNRDDQIGGALYEEISSSRRGCTAVELARKIHVSEDKATKILQKLCDDVIIICIDGKYFVPDQAPKNDVAEAPSIERSKTKQSVDDIQVDQPPSAGLQADTIYRRVGDLQTLRPEEESVMVQSQGVTFLRHRLSKQDRPGHVSDSGGGGQQMVRKNCSSMQCPVAIDKQREIEDIFRRIVEVLPSEGGFVQSTAIAQKTKLGNSKSSVNRYLYFLVEQQVLVRDGKTFALKKPVTGEDLTVLAAQLAKRPEGKKNSASSIGQPTDCSCPNRGSSCNHFHQHFHQNVTNIHVGDQKTFIGSEHLERSDN